MHALLDTISAYPHVALAIIFLTAFLESAAFIGTIIPAGVVMFTGGALIGAGVLDVWLTLGIAFLGAVAGDALSYEFGRHHAARIRASRFVARHARVFNRGEQFVERYGGKSVLFARFVAPVRAVVPVIAGIARMPRLRFYFINLLSAAIWAPMHVLPGVIFGASVRVAEAVTARLALLLLLVAGVLWAAIRLVRVTIDMVLPKVIIWRDHAVRWAAARDTRGARVVMFFLDPHKPESEVLLALALLLLGSGWLFLGILEDVVTQDRLLQLDVAAFHFFQSLRTSVADRVMVVLTELGNVGVLLPLSLLVFAWLLLRRCWHTAAYWVAAVLFSQVLIKLLKFTLGRARPLDLYPGAAIEQFSFPSGHATSSMVIYGFLAFLLARRQAPTVRVGISAVAVSGIVLVGLSRLYLGAHWLSDVLGGFSLGLAWIALLAMVYTHYRVNENLQPEKLTALSAGLLLFFAPWYVGMHLAADSERYAPQQPLTVFSAGQWSSDVWKQLPQRRREIRGAREEALPVHWADSAADIARTMTQAGWREAPDWSMRTALLWLTPGTALTALPVLPKFNRGTGSELAFVCGAPGQTTARTVLRLWRSDFAVRESASQPLKPVWYGALYREDFRRPFGLITIYRTARDAATGLPRGCSAGSTAPFSGADGLAPREAGHDAKSENPIR
jgi:membrane protein DedA with SNARE-associated domain/membrane-associated phospholipid phosphatase